MFANDISFDGTTSPNSALTRPLTPPYNGASIKLLDTTKDLDVAVYSKFKPSIHSTQTFKKAGYVLFLVPRSFVTLTPDIYTPMYKTLVRPQLEYAIQALSSFHKKDIDHLTRLQRQATRMVKGCRDLSYEERLGKLKLFSIARRRLKGDLILA